MNWTHIAKDITEATGTAFQLSDRRSVGGGCINQGAMISDGRSRFFVKLNQADKLSMFAAEAAGLEQMGATHTIRVPQPICCGITENTSYLVLEWLELGASGAAAWAAMGRQLAAMHQWIPKPAPGEVWESQFGWDRHNTIGSTPQINHWLPNWVEFWTQHRIGYQLQLARQRNGHFPRADRLLAVIPDLLANHNPRPSLVHGDLWSGNAAITRNGEPTIFDPATYWGDREVDLAMTELFGGFPTDFYQGYNQVFPLEKGYHKRKTLYNLYHILNHFNLFGGSYEAQANRMIDQLL